jgi:hypothetical protein
VLDDAKQNNADDQVREEEVCEESVPVRGMYCSMR